MTISIKSEMDSRVLLYPLVKALKSYGTVLLVSSNRILERLIMSEEEGGFRNIRVIVDMSGAADDVYVTYGIAEGDFDFVVLDNIGVTEYDKCLFVVGAGSSDYFREDMQTELDEDINGTHTFIFQFGQAERNAKEAKKKQMPKEAKDVDPDYDPADKFRSAESEERRKQQEARVFRMKYPLFQQLEDVEAKHIFYKPDNGFIGALYKVVGADLNIQAIQFTKEVRQQDEGGCGIKRRSR